MENVKDQLDVVATYNMQSFNQCFSKDLGPQVSVNAYRKHLQKIEDQVT